MLFVLGEFVPCDHLSDAISQTYRLRFRSLGPPRSVAKFQLEDEEGIGIGGGIGYCCRDDDDGGCICRQEGLLKYCTVWCNSVGTHSEQNTYVS